MRHYDYDDDEDDDGMFVEIICLNNIVLTVYEFKLKVLFQFVYFIKLPM